MRLTRRALQGAGAGCGSPLSPGSKMNPAGIRLGTCIGLFVRKAKREKKSVIKYREFWGTKKREKLAQSLSVVKFEQQYGLANPEPFNRYSFRPTKVGGDFRAWPTLPQLAAIPPVNGLMEKRGGALIDIERSKLETRMKAYFDPAVSWDASNLPLIHCAMRRHGTTLIKRASG
jgi:hypothetical protein